MNRKITFLLSLLILTFSLQSKAQAPITGPKVLCVGSTIVLSSTDPGGTWTSSNTSVATISLAGSTVYAHPDPTPLPISSVSGITVITYSSAAGVVTTTVTVGTGPISGPTSVCQGATINLSSAASGGTWSTDVTTIAVASVDAITGVVTSGTPTSSTSTPVIIYYTNSCGEDSYIIDVFPTTQPITGSNEVCVGATITLSNPVLGGTWSSTNTTVATVAAGDVFGASQGTTVIRYSNGCGIASHSVSVLPNVLPITGPSTACIGAATYLSDPIAGGTWSSSNTTVATVVGGIVYASSGGTTVISYSNGCGIETFTITTMGTGPITGPSSVCEGATVTLSAAYGGGSWSTDVATIGVASINPVTGVVTGGTPTSLPSTGVIMHYNNACGVDNFAMNVFPNTLPITGAIDTVCTGNSIYLSDATIGGTWSSNNTTVATVATGVVSAVTGGSTVISYSNGCGVATYTVVVNISPNPVVGLNSFCLGSTALLTATPTGGTWSSSNTLVADINTATGVVTGSGVGSACTSYNMPNGCSSVFCVVVSNCPACPINSDFELGDYSQWKYYVGSCCPGGLIAANTLITTPPAAGYIPCAFALTGPAPFVTGTDPLGGFPVVGAGVYSLRIGSGRTNRWAEKAVYYVHVPPGPGAYSLIYQYAIVTENPAGHNFNEQPRFTVRAVDVTGVADTVNDGTVLPCANFLYVPNPAGGGLPGWNGLVSGNAACGGFANDVYYKPWSTTSINLTGMGGSTIRMEFAAGDCDLGGHYCYGYVDMTCGTFAIGNLTCGDSIATVTAPSGFANYAWYDSTTFGYLYGTTQTITFPTPLTPTTYAVIMTPYPGFGCPDTLYTRISPANLQLHPKPDTMICAGQSATISVNATDIALPLTYQWTPTTGLSCATCADPVVTPFAGNNIYNVIVTDDAGCEKSGTQRVFVDSVAITTAATNTSCFGFSDGTATATTTSGISPFAYSWTTVPTQVTSGATNLAVGAYSVTVTDSLGCVATGNATVTQPPPLTMSIAGTDNPTTCSGNDGAIRIGGFTTGDVITIKYLYTATGTTTTVAATGTYTASPTVVIPGLSAGVYDSIQVIPTGCPYNTLGPVTLVDPAPPALPYVNSNSPVCVGQPLNLTTTDITPGVTYSWAGPLGFTSAIQTPSITPVNLSHAGWYVVTVTKDNCTSSDSTNVVIIDTPIAQASNNSPKCSDFDTVQLNSSNGRPGTGDVFVWNGPDNFYSTFQNPILIHPAASAAGAYTVTVTRDGCAVSAVTTVTVHATPAPPPASDTNYCQFADAVPLSATGTNVLWYTSMSSTVGSSVAPIPVTTEPLIKTWYVTQTSNTIPACTSERAAVTVGVYRLPEPKFTITDSVFCEGTYFTFEVRDQNTGVDYEGLTWNFGTDVVQDVNPVLHSFSTPGPIDVTVSVNYKVCPDTQLKHSVLVYPYPSLQLGDDTAICPGSQKVVIGDASNTDNPNARWIWNTGETTSKIDVVAPGTYYVKVTVGGCSTSDTIIVGNDCYMSMPNVFTPNGDGVNDFFFPRQYLTRGLTSFNMTIYNRWGQVVFSSNNIEGRGWDGNFNDVPQPQGVFIYVLDATFKDGQKEHHQGNITLLR